MDCSTVVKVPLTHGKVALVDEADYELVSRYRWRAVRNGKWYAYSYIVGRPVAMHRLILNAGPGEEVDHINGDGLDNRRPNLRLCSHAENTRNVGKYKHNRSGYKGVYWDSTRKGRPWRAQIRHNHRVYRLGRFEDPVAAARAYNEAALDLHGEFARINDLP